jgi:c-di-GMP-binding flagellar brake protein YcgR
MSSSKPKNALKQIDRRRRRHVRYRTDFRVTVNHLLEHQYQKLEGHCRDLSEAGIGILLAEELNTGEVTGLHFSLPGSTSPWEVRAVVRHRRGFQYGFEFLSLSGEQQESLKSYVNSLEPLD